MIRKLWVKFDGLDVKCMCNQNDRKCEIEECEEYVVKFTPADRLAKRRLSSSPQQFEEKKRRLSEECRTVMDSQIIKDLIKGSK